LYFRTGSAITRPLAARLVRAAVATTLLNQQRSFFEPFPANDWLLPYWQEFPLRPDQESQMPKLKTKSGAKKRFKITGTGKVVAAQSGKRHGMIKRTTKQIRQLRGTRVIFKSDGDNIKKYWMPNG
jgi:large subunit ribosomal protein L35